MSLEISGKVFKVLTEQTGQGKNGNWVKQDFVIETEEQYPKKVSFSAWGDKVDVVRKFRNGDRVKVAFNVESREFNERWYTDLKPWKIDMLGTSDTADNSTSEPTVQPSAFQSSNEDVLPF